MQTFNAPVSKPLLAILLLVGLCLASASAIADAADQDQQEEDSNQTSGSMEEVLVTADGSQVELSPEYAGGQVARGGRAGLFGNLDMMDSPFVSTNFTSEFILNQQATGAGDVLQNDPSVRVARGFGNFQEVYFIRGFNMFSDDMTYNGIYGILPRQFVAAEFLERVEVFRGASTFINGAAPGGSGIGGTVNMVPKRASDEPLTRLTVGYEQQGQYHGALDVGRRFGESGEHGLRFNLAYRDGETAVDDQDRELTVAALGYDFSGERFRLSADIGYQDHVIDDPRPSVTPFGGIAEEPSASSNFAQPWTTSSEEQFFYVARGEYDLTDNVSIWAAIGGRDSKEFNDLANPNANPDGSTSAFRFTNYREDDVLSMDTGIRFDFDTGSVGHRLIASYSKYDFDSKNAFDFYFDLIISDLYNPVVVPPPSENPFSGGDLSNPLTTLTNDNQSIAIADTMSFMDGKVLLTLGLRDQNIENESFDFNTGASFGAYDDSDTTPIGAIVVRLNDTFAMYANYAETLVPGPVAPLTNGGVPVENGGEVFPPTANEQVEIGLKFDTGNLGGNISIFAIEQPLGIIIDNVFSNSGKREHRGIELTMFGEPTEGLRLVGGLTYLDAELSRTQDGLFEGNRPTGVPEFIANLNVEWDIARVEGLTLEARGIYTDSQYADAANTLSVSSWTRFDIGARYTTEVGERPMTIRARINNVADSDQWISVGGFPGANYMVLGDPITLVLSASFDF
jgi:iron complex outermembrane receptor protein